MEKKVFAPRLKLLAHLTKQGLHHSSLYKMGLKTGIFFERLASQEWLLKPNVYFCAVFRFGSTLASLRLMQDRGNMPRTKPVQFWDILRNTFQFHIRFQSLVGSFEVWMLMCDCGVIHIILPTSTDQIALPDFNAGAMENWGLITYRETVLLYDEEFSSNSNKERIATIIAHELAHMVSFQRHLSIPIASSSLQCKELLHQYIF